MQPHPANSDRVAAPVDRARGEMKSEQGKYLVKNFTEADEIKLESFAVHGIGALVFLTQHSGSLSFQHDMTAAQAREAAAALLALADEADKLNAEAAAEQVAA